MYYSKHKRLYWACLMFKGTRQDFPCGCVSVFLCSSISVFHLVSQVSFKIPSNNGIIFQQLMTKVICINHKGNCCSMCSFFHSFFIWIWQTQNFPPLPSIFFHIPLHLSFPSIFLSPFSVSFSFSFPLSLPCFCSALEELCLQESLAGGISSWRNSGIH